MNTTAATTRPVEALRAAQSTPTDVPGQLQWFKPGSEEYIEWASQREQFLAAIKPETEEGKAILSDIVEALLRQDIPTGPIGAISMVLRATRRARIAIKKRQDWNTVLWIVLQRTFTPVIEPDEDFVLSFAQLQYIWTAEAGGDCSVRDYKQLYAVITTRLRAGPLKNAILKYPRLDAYTAVKLRQFQQSYLHYYTVIERGL